ncbi:MAG: ABC transporter permease [Clostridia bacterium]|nr:ABC transporter permease [Clostridia bacterium]
MRKTLKYSFLFSELVKRDFKKKYKSTYLGMLWSLVSPLMTLFVMSLLFSSLFGGSTPHYIIYLFCGNICFSYFSDATGGTMNALLSNSEIFSKINLPKALFLLSRSVTSFINFALTLAVFFVFCLFDGIYFGAHLWALIYPIATLAVFNIGMGLILSALFVLFRDLQYLWSVASLLIMYMSAIFYTTDAFGEGARRLFYLNPIYVYITYFRETVISSSLPSVTLHLLCLFYAVSALFVGGFIYKKLNYKFVYYI